MGFRLLTDGSLAFDTIEEALAAQEAKQQRMQRTVVHHAMPPEAAVHLAKIDELRAQHVAGAQSRQQDVQRKRLMGGSEKWTKLVETLGDVHQELLATISERGEVTTRELTDLHPGKDIGKLMSVIRERIEKAGFKNGEVLEWTVSGFGKEKKSTYAAGPALRAAAKEQ